MSGKFSRDVAWNVASLAIGGACGVLLSYLIGVRYGASALGIFNQVFAFYILYAQLAALGFQYSVLKHLAETDDAATRRAIVTSAVVVTTLTSGVFSTALYLSADVIGELLGSAEVATGIRYAAPGVFAFALSKVAMGALNALRRMRIYALLFAGRFVLMVAAFGWCAATDADRATLPIVLTLAEAVTCLIALIAVADQLGVVPRAALRTWAGTHRRFGLKGFMSGTLSELNTRVDVLILGAYTTDAVVGAYSFAATLAEGIYQLLIVLRTNYAPVLIRLWSSGATDELTATIRRARNRTYAGAVVVGALAVGGYALAIPWVTDDPALIDSWRYFAALIAGMVASAGYQPIQPLLLYGGLPGWHTLLLLGIVVINAALNVILIAAVGPVGSAIATGTAFVLGVMLLRTLVARLMQLRI